MEVLEDFFLENIEIFFVIFVNLIGGVTIGLKNKIFVNIFFNDNVYGIIEFVEV